MKDVEVIQLKNNWPGWWAKMEMFRPDLPMGKTLFLDLDLVILENLDELIEQDTEFMICPAIGKPRRQEENKIKVGYNASVILFERGEITEKIYNEFNTDPKMFMSQFRGDQDFLKTFFPDFDKFPKEWIRKIRWCFDEDNKKFGVPSELKILLCMPWKNDKAARRLNIVKRLWK
jgi:alpha-N-acetylglucosamine transferase